MSLAIFYALQLTPETPHEEDFQRLHDCPEAKTALTPRRPRAVVLGCEAGGVLLALKYLLQIELAIEPDRRALECT